VLEERYHGYGIQRETATSNDYFAAAIMAQLFNARQLQEPRLISGLPDGTRAWASHNCLIINDGPDHYRIIIDGEASGLNKSGIDAMKRYSERHCSAKSTPDIAARENARIAFRSGCQSK